MYQKNKIITKNQTMETKEILDDNTANWKMTRMKWIDLGK